MAVIPHRGKFRQRADREVIRMQPKQLTNAVSQASQVDRLVSEVIVSHNQRCPQCRHHSVSLRLQRGRVISGKASCEHCGLRVEVAKLPNSIIAKCPRCGGVSVIAQGRREDGSTFFAFACHRCAWVSDDTWTKVAFVLLSH